MTSNVLDPASMRKTLADALNDDKVLHKTEEITPLCNTLSRGYYGRQFQGQRTTRYHFCKATMLDDRTTGNRTKLFYSFGSPISGGNRILQQFYPQREVVYTPLNSELQPGWALVSSRDRFFSDRKFDQNVDLPHSKQPGGNNCRAIRQEVTLPLSYSTRTVMQEEKIATSEDRALIYISRHRFSYCGQATPGSIRGQFTARRITGRNCNPDSCGIYPQSRSWFCAARHNDQKRRESNHRGYANRTTFPAIFFKKNDVNCGAASWRALSSCLQQLTKETLPVALFSRPPVVRFVPERTVCSCGGQLGVQKTRCKTVFSMTGPFIAHETVLKCQSCSSFFGSEALLELVPKWCNIGYDVLVHVGRALFQRYRTIQEVRIELYSRNVQISDSEISYLGYKFIATLAACHQQATPRIRQSMEPSGGYVLHLDATHDGNAPALMTGMDSLSEIVLGNVKIPSEHADYIAPFLQKLQKDFGNPQACVHDMGNGICKAVAEVFPDTPDFICHFHFLRDIGKDLLEPVYSSLRSYLRKHKISSRLHALAREIKQRISHQDSNPELLARAFLAGELPEKTDLLFLASTYSMTLWILQGKNSGDGYGFPFDRPLLVFAERLCEVQQQLSKIVACCPDTDKAGKKSVNKLARIVATIINDTLFQQDIQELHWRCQVFDSLRKAMRIAPPNGKKGLNDEGEDAAIGTICAGVRQFRGQLDDNATWSKDKLCRKMAKQIDKWSEKLFADPIEVDTPQGSVTIYPQRTNNILEQFFRGVRQKQRRKTGNNSLRPMLHAMLADTPLVKNLDNDEYMKILLNGKNNLEELFANLKPEITAGSTDLPVEIDRLLPGFRKLITQQTLPVQVAHLLSKSKIMAKFN